MKKLFTSSFSDIGLSLWGHKKPKEWGVRWRKRPTPNRVRNKTKTRHVGNMNVFYTRNFKRKRPARLLICFFLYLASLVRVTVEILIKSCRSALMRRAVERKQPSRRNELLTHFCDWKLWHLIIIIKPASYFRCFADTIYTHLESQLGNHIWLKPTSNRYEPTQPHRPLFLVHS